MMTSPCKDTARSQTLTLNYRLPHRSRDQVVVRGAHASIVARAPSSLGIDFTPEVMAGIFVAVVVVVVVNCLLNIFCPIMFG